jgi:hypothetical protein
MSRRFDTYTSITWPCWSTPGETYCQMLATLAEVSSTNQRWPRHCVGMAVPRRRVTVGVLNPAVDRDVINQDAAFREEFFDIAVWQAVAQQPAHSQQDHLGGDRYLTKETDNEELQQFISTRPHQRAPNPPAQQRHRQRTSKLQVVREVAHPDPSSTVPHSATHGHERSLGLPARDDHRARPSSKRRSPVCLIRSKPTT